jgi:undecaprenyl-diphosphatase
MSTKTMTATSIQGLHQRKNNMTGLRSAGLLAKWPIIGISMFVLGALIFGGLTFNLYAHGPLLAWDNKIANTLPAIGLNSPPSVKIIMDAGFYTGEHVLIVLGLLLGIYFTIKRNWQELVMLLAGVAGSQLLFHFISLSVARPRPPTQIWIILTSPGFPSGHAITVVAFYGLLAYLIAPKMPSTFWKVVVVAAGLLIIGFVGFSRIFTAGHYLTDVLAGYSVGIAWSALIYTLIELYYQKRNRKQV